MCIRDRAGCRAGSAECLAYFLAWMRVVWLRGRCWWVAGWAGSAGCPEPPSNGQDRMCVASKVVLPTKECSEPRPDSMFRKGRHRPGLRCMIRSVSPVVPPTHPLAGQNVGYARVSSASQNLDGQDDALRAVGCEKVFADTASGTLTQRPELAACLEYLRAGDTLVVWRLDRLGRSLRHLVETVNGLAERGVRSGPCTRGSTPRPAPGG